MARAPAECPDFSGVYWYPGFEQQSEACTVLTKFGFGSGLPIPARGAAPGRGWRGVPSGGWHQIVARTKIEVRQHDCQRITFYAPYGIHYVRKNYDRVLENVEREGVRYRVVLDLAYDYSPRYFRVDKWVALDVDLRPGDWREVRWEEGSLYLRYRFRAEGFGAGWSRNYLTLRLRKLPGGALRYDLRHDQTGPGDHEIVCTLEPAAEGAAEEPGPRQPEGGR